MNKYRILKDDFSGGSIDPALHSRTSLKQYATGAKTLKNFIVLPNGNIANRKGTWYVAQAKVNTATRLIPFIFSDEEAYVLEVSNLCMRFYHDGAQLQSGGGAYELVTPWATADLEDLCMDAQSADVIFCTHPKYKPMVLTRYADTSWTLVEYVNTNGPFMLANSTSTITIAAGATTTPTTAEITRITADTVAKVTSANSFTGGEKVFITGVVGMTQVNDRVFTVATSAPYAPDPAFFYLLGEDSSGYDAYVSGGTWRQTTTLIVSGGDFSTTAGASHVGVLVEVRHLVPSQSVVTTFSTSTSSTAIKCGGTWRLSVSGTGTGTLVVEKSLDGSTWTIERVVQCSGVAIDQVGTVLQSQCQIRLTYTVSSGSITTTLSSDPFEWVGVAKVRALQSSTVADVTIDVEISSTDATSLWAEGSWSDFRGWPTCVAFWEERLAFAGTNAEPDTVWFTETGNYYSFKRNTTSLDTDAIYRRLPGREMNRIRRMVPSVSLLLLTSSGEWSVNSDGAFTPTSVVTKRCGSYGASKYTPVVVGTRMLYINAVRTQVRDTSYSTEADGFVGRDLTVFGAHLFTGSTIKEIAYQQEPNRIVWAIRSDGYLLSLTYVPELEMFAWCYHETEGAIGSTVGSFKSVCCIPGTTEDEVWFVVDRGGTQFIERMVSSTTGVYTDCSTLYAGASKTIIAISKATKGVVQTSAAHGLSNGNVVFISGVLGMTQINGKYYTVRDVTSDTFTLEYRGVAVNTSTGYSTYTSGGTAQVSTNSMSVPTALNGRLMYLSMYSTTLDFLSIRVGEVTAGVVAYTSPAGGVNYYGSYIVAGLQYNCDVELLAPDLNSLGTIQGRLTGISEISLRLYASRGGYMGYDEDSLKRMSYSPADHSNPGVTYTIPGVSGYDDDRFVCDDIASSVLFTGTVRETMSAGMESPMCLWIRQVQPLPMIIQGVIYDLAVGG